MHWKPHHAWSVHYICQEAQTRWKTEEVVQSPDQLDRGTDMELTNCIEAVSTIGDTTRVYLIRNTNIIVRSYEDEDRFWRNHFFYKLDHFKPAVCLPESPEPSVSVGSCVDP